MRYVLIGGGLASATAAEHIRGRDTDGEILIIGAEPHLPYHRPPLSKEYLRGNAQIAGTLVHPEGWYQDQKIQVLQEMPVTGLDPGAKRITLTGGRALSYDRALLATGAEPRQLPVPGHDLPGVHLLRTLDDSTAIRREIEGGAKRATIVGGGYIGVEVAADCLQKGVSVTLLERGKQLWGRFAGPHVAEFLTGLLRSHGADLRFGEEAVAFTGPGRVARVRLKSGGEVAGDFAVVGVGVAPRTSLAQAAGLNVDPWHGIHVNQFLETGAPGLWAAGDATCFFDPVYSRAWHVEHWNNAFWHGEIAGTNMAGGHVAYDHVPNFFSDFLGNHMELFGDPQDWKRTLLAGEPASGKLSELYLDNQDRVQMVIALNPAGDELEVLEKIARQRPPVRGREAEIARHEFSLANLVT